MYTSNKMKWARMLSMHIYIVTCFVHDTAPETFIASFPKFIAEAAKLLRNYCV